MDEANRLPHPDRDRPLHEVIKDFGRRLRPGGPHGEIDEWSVYDESFRRLVSWAEESGRFYQGLQALKEGGREHDLTYQDSLAFVRDDVAVFDLRPANVVKTPDGLILPIDSIPVQLDEKARAILTGIRIRTPTTSTTGPSPHPHFMGMSVREMLSVFFPLGGT